MCLLRFVCSLVLLAATAAPAVPQPPAAPARKGDLSGNAAKAAAFAAAEAVRYDIRHADGPKAALQLLPEPVLRWSIALRGEVHGVVVLWT